MLEGQAEKKEIMEISTLLSKCKFIKQQVVSYHHSIVRGYDPEEFNNRCSLAPVLGTVCDQQISADVAWKIPYHISEWLKSKGREFKASVIRSIGRRELRDWLATHMFDKWPTRMSSKDRGKWLDEVSSYLVQTCEKIELEYQDDPDSIFTVSDGTLSVPLIYFLLRQFPGIGPKKASMIARDFGRGCAWLTSIKQRLQKKGIEIKVERPYFTEVPIDVHVRRVLQRLGFARYREPQDFQNLARLIYPDNPGLVDDFIWNLGRNLCKTQPNCQVCRLRAICEYYKRRLYDLHRKRHS